MDMDFPVGKANWHCDRVEIHCGTHPVEMVDAGQFRKERPKVQGKAAILHSLRQTVPMPLTLSRF
ncbi:MULTISPECIES: hypothetical protein [unclassified Rhizobium]|uniref:hypothetical protein n=1 Tax=unclassified Rhizobium TaxID=2613769 RepID=UPI001C831F19|nr:MULTISPECIES: hypothetical protein [unclassified Rhizobium]MBX5227723.1 hypothetical protein [Rhizobium sp. NLR9b]MBX5239734.1 hypothetical protein [Rhizobium sp. NLR22b]MBX5288767.1 hypothetical protein [Rhizobium sp. NLR10b]